MVSHGLCVCHTAFSEFSSFTKKYHYLWLFQFWHYLGESYKVDVTSVIDQKEENIQTLDRKLSLRPHKEDLQNTNILNSNSLISFSLISRFRSWSRTSSRSKITHCKEKRWLPLQLFTIQKRKRTQTTSSNRGTFSLSFSFLIFSS